MTIRNLLTVFFIQFCTSFSPLSLRTRNRIAWISGTAGTEPEFGNNLAVHSARVAVSQGSCPCRRQFRLLLSKEGFPISTSEPPDAGSSNRWSKESQRKLELNSKIKDDGGKRAVYGQKTKSAQNSYKLKYCDTSVLKNLMAFESLATLLEALELFINEPIDGPVTAQQAVAALNHLKRLSKQAGRAESARAEICMRWYATVAANGMRRLSGKHIALVLNAIREYLRIGKNGHLESIDSSYLVLFDASIQRLKQLALLFKSGTEMDGSYLLDSQNIANIVNALSAVRYQDRALYRMLSEATLKLPIRDFGPQAVANILNGFTRIEMWDEELLDHLSIAAVSMDLSSFSAQHIANILNAFHKAGVYHLALFQHMSAAAQILPANSFSVQVWVGIPFQFFRGLICRFSATFACSRNSIQMIFLQLLTPDCVFLESGCR